MLTTIHFKTSHLPSVTVNRFSRHIMNFISETFNTNSVINLEDAYFINFTVIITGQIIKQPIIKFLENECSKYGCSHSDFFFQTLS